MIESNELIKQIATEISNAMETRVTIVLASIVKFLLIEGLPEETLETMLQTAHIELKMRKVDIVVMDTLANELVARDARIQELDNDNQELRKLVITFIYKGNNNETPTERHETGVGRPAPDAGTHGTENPPALRLGRPSKPPQTA